MELGVESTFRPYNSPFDCSRSTDSSAMSSYCNGVGDRTGPSSSGSRLFQLSPDMLSSIWTAESKDGSTASEAGNSGKMDGTSVKDASSPPAAAGDNNEEKPTAFPTATATITNYTNTGTGRESSSPLSGSTGTTSSSSASSSLEISALELGSSLFADSVWSSKGSFNDVGSFGSSEEEKRFLAEGAKAYLKPPASAPGSAAWGSFWSDLSPSLSPSNSETNLHHFGSPALANPFSTWNNSPATTATVNRRSAPPNSSPFSSGSVSPISRKHLSPGMGPSMNGIGNQSTVTVNHHNHHYRPGVFNNHPALNLQNNNAGFAGHSQQRQYRRSASHPANHLHNHQQHNNHVPTAVGGPYNLNDNLGASFYDGQNVTDFSNGWNMESVNGYHQDPHRSYNPHSTGNTLNGLDSMKYSLEPHLMDIMRSASGWDDSSSGKGRQQFFGTYQSYDASRFSDILDPFDQMVPSSMSPLSSRMSPRNHSTGSDFGGDAMHVYSRKVFVGGLPPDIDEEEITASFRRFGPLIVDWPHKAESKSYFPPKGYAFLLFQDETSVHGLLDASIQEGDKLYFYVSSPTSKDKPVQIRPWRLNDNECYLDTQSKLDPRLTVFVGGVPRPLKAPELALLMNQRFGYVAYAGIDVDSELKYPKGAGRITFSNQQSYIAAINARFVQLQNGEIDKRVELKPYVLDDQICDYCHGMKCSGRSAPLFCSQVGCLAYLCEHCWGPYHSSPGKDHHKPVTKESSVDRSRPAAMRW